MLGNQNYSGFLQHIPGCNALWITIWGWRLAQLVQPDQKNTSKMPFNYITTYSTSVTCGHTFQIKVFSLFLIFSLLWMNIKDINYETTDVEFVSYFRLFKLATFHFDNSFAAAIVHGHKLEVCFQPLAC